MVHPSQQRSAFAPRRPAATLNIVRDGRVRSIPIGSAPALALAAAFALFAAAFIGATCYWVYRDDIVAGSLARQVAMQYGYEQRIAALRAELDRAASRRLVEARGVEGQLALLLERQAVIDGRQGTLDDLQQRAELAGIDAPSLAAAEPIGPAAAGTQGAAAAPSVGPAPLAFVPAESSAGSVIDEVLLGGHPTSPAGSVGEIAPTLAEIQARLDAADGRQAATLDALATAAAKKADALSAALAPLGISVDAAGEEPQGGPFIAAASLHFVERAAMLSRALDDIGALRRTADAVPLRMPVEGRRVSSRFGYRSDPFLKRAAFHAGLDFVAAAGTPARATAAGEVVAAGWSGGYGNMVEIRHADGLSTRYGHLSEILVSKGDRVLPGNVVGRVGSTGRSTGPHLHYETRRHGQAVDPTPYLAAGRALRG